MVQPCCDSCISKSMFLSLADIFVEMCFVVVSGLCVCRKTLDLILLQAVTAIVSFQGLPKKKIFPTQMFSHLFCTGIIGKKKSENKGPSIFLCRHYSILFQKCQGNLDTSY